MVRKIILITLGVLEVGLVLLLVLTNLNSFASSINRLGEILKIGSLKNYFELSNESSSVIIEQSVNEIADWVVGKSNEVSNYFNQPFYVIILDLFTKVFDLLLNFIIYFCNYGLTLIVVLYLTLHEIFVSEQLKIKTTPFAYTYMKADGVVDGIISKIKIIINKILDFLYKERRIIVLLIAINLLASGILFRIIVEVIIFLITYVIRMINLETYLLIFEIIKFLFIKIYPNLKYIPLWIIILSLIALIFIRALSRAEYKLKKNHERLKKFAKDELTQTTFINGPPGTGKTLLNVSLSLASEESFIDELEGKLLDYEMKYKYLNFAKVRQNQDLYPEHKDYINTYNLLNNRGSFLISNYAIYSPLFNEYSKIFNFEFMRVNKETLYYPLEEYIVISLSEFDKEYNSHDNMKEVGIDGAATFFSTVSHDLKRHAKVFVDYQLKDQVPLRIRGNSEFFLNVKEKQKKYPILLYLFYLPFKITYRLIRFFILKYEQKKRNISKHSNRKGKANYKRNDFTFPYIFLRDIGNKISKICSWFDQYYYFKLKVILNQEGERKEGIKKYLHINIRDLSYKNQKLYDSTFLSYAYEEKKNKDFKDLDKFTKLSPSKSELAKCHSRFYDKINN